MFRRVTLEQWHDIVPYLCFALIGGAFIIIVIRALTMSKSQVTKLSHLPLEDNPNDQSES